MFQSIERLHTLLESDGVAISPSPFLDSVPPPLSMDGLPDRVEGMLLGLAIGDSLGNTSESQSPLVRRKRNGEICDYLPNRYADARPVGLPSDDTQMAFWTLEHFLEHGRLLPEALATVFCSNRIFGLGTAMRSFIHQFKDCGVPWWQAGVGSAGNGALMRIAPVLVPHLRQPSPALWADTVLAAMLTHNDPGSTASCVAFINVLWQALSLRELPARGWWTETVCEVALGLEGDTRFRPRHPAIPYRHDGPLADFSRKVVHEALHHGWSVLEACNRWHSGAYLLETLPSVLYILETCGHDPELAIVRAVNDTRDNDTIAAIVGALHGKEALPRRWREQLLGRTQENDDGKVFQVIRQCGDRYLTREQEEAAGPKR